MSERKLWELSADLSFEARPMDGAKEEALVKSDLSLAGGRRGIDRTKIPAVFVLYC